MSFGAIAIPPSFHLKGEISAGEALSALTISIIAGSSVYNIGYFTPIDVGQISLLSAQDLVGGIVYSIPIIIISLFSFRVTIRFSMLGHAIRWLWLALVIDIISVMITTACFWLVPPRFMFNDFSAALVSILLVWGTAQRFLRWDNFQFSVFVFCLLYIAFFAGFSQFYFEANDPSPRISHVDLRDGASVDGHIMRFTSGYLFLLNDLKLVVLSNANVASIQLPLSSHS